MQLRSASGRNDFDLIVHAAHAVDRTNRFLRHLLVKIRAEHSGEDDLVFAQFDMDLTARKIRITGKRVVNFGVKMDANVGRAVLVAWNVRRQRVPSGGDRPDFRLPNRATEPVPGQRQRRYFYRAKTPSGDGPRLRNSHGSGRSSSPPPEFPAEPRRPLSRAPLMRLMTASASDGRHLARFEASTSVVGAFRKKILSPCFFVVTCLTGAAGHGVGPPGLFVEVSSPILIVDSTVWHLIGLPSDFNFLFALFDAAHVRIGRLWPADGGRVADFGGRMLDLTAGFNVCVGLFDDDFLGRLLDHFVGGELFRSAFRASGRVDGVGIVVGDGRSGPT